MNLIEVSTHNYNIYTQDLNSKLVTDNKATKILYITTDVVRKMRLRTPDIVNKEEFLSFDEI